MINRSPHGHDKEALARQSKRVLVVEDELFIRILISDALREEGYVVLEAFNGDEAADILNSGVTVQLILSDVRMPGLLDGLGLLNFTRQRFPGLPVILTSGHLEPGLAFAEGANHFVQKPYKLESVLELIATELTKSE